jgi:hypothetical protein
MRGLRLRLFAALVAALLVVAGCGNAEQDTAEDAGTVMPKDEAIAAVTERCAQVNETFEEVDFEEEPGRVADELEEFAADVRAMPPPAEDQEALESLLTALEDSAATWREAAEAPEGEKGEAVGAAFESFGPAEEAAVEFGIGPLQDCGREVEEPDPDAERVDVTAREYEFDIPATAPAGPVSFVLSNEGEEPHHMVVVAFTGDETVEDLFAAEEAGEDPEQFVEDIGDSPAATPGEETVLNADLSPGRYAMLCFISAPDGEPHAFKGMHAEFTVG